MALERIDKTLANSGIGTRSEVRKLIKNGCVLVNGTVVKNIDCKINAEMDKITVNGKETNCKKYIYIMLNKPQGVVCATNDNVHKTVIDILPDNLKRKDLFPVGRLDVDTTGLLIITNDGDFAHKVISPKNKVYKHYVAILDKPVTKDDIKAFKDGIVFKDGTVCRSAELSVINTDTNCEVLVKICEGMFHQVKKMFITRGKKVLFLNRLQIGELRLFSNLNKGNCRELTKLETDRIFMGKLH